MYEEWKVIEGHDSLYEISDKGRVRNTLTNKILKQHKNAYGYYCLGLRFEGRKQKSYLVHRLIAKVFIPNPENKPQINHKDCNKTNNSIDNLEWCTKNENNLHAFANGLIDRRGEKASGSKLTEKQVLEIRELCKTMEQKDIAPMFGINKSHVSNIFTRKSWKHI